MPTCLERANTYVYRERFAIVCGRCGRHPTSQPTHRHQRQAENQADNSTAEFVPLLLSLQISFRLCTGGRCTILANRLHQEGQLPPPV